MTFRPNCADSPIEKTFVLTLIEAGEAKLIRSPIHDLENGSQPVSLAALD